MNCHPQIIAVKLPAMKMSLYFSCLIGFLVGCSTVFETSKYKTSTITFQFGEVEYSVMWKTSTTIIPKVKYMEENPVWPSVLDAMPLPRGYVFVPMMCSLHPWSENVTVVGDDGEPDGTLHADGIATVLRPFLSGTQSQRFYFRDISWAIIKR